MTSIICILGMHRSGTSCLTGSLENYGLHLGDVNNDAPHNSKGNKENSRTWQINDLVLEQSGGSWDKPPERLIWDDAAKRMGEEFIQSYELSPIWGFKDPRCVLTVPFWLGLTPDISFVATYRHPVSVAKSLEKRNGFTLQKSFDLWLNYNQLLLEYKEQFKFPLLCFDSKPDEYLRAVRNVALSYELPLANSTGDLGFFDDSLRQTLSCKNQTKNAPSECLELYEQLCTMTNR